MKIKTNFILFLIFASCISSAQKKHSIGFQTGMMQFTQSKYSLNLNYWGFQYFRSFSKNIYLSVHLSKWTTWNDKFLPRQFGEVYSNCWYDISNVKSCEKKLLLRKNYKMFDLGVNYSLVEKVKMSKLLVGVRLSLASGKNTYIDSVIAPTSPPFDNIEYIYRNTNPTYVGMVPSIDYRYYIWKKRISLGSTIEARKYFGLKDIQFDLGFNINYNF